MFKTIKNIYKTKNNKKELFFLEVIVENKINYNYLINNYHLFSKKDKIILAKQFISKNLVTGKYKNKINKDFLLWLYQNDLIFEIKDILKERKSFSNYITLCEKQIEILMLEFN